MTQAQGERFEQALNTMAEGPRPATVLDLAQQAGMKSQLTDLHSELVDYEALKCGKSIVFRSDSFDELPQALI